MNRQIAPIGFVAVKATTLKDGEWVTTEGQAPVETISGWRNRMEDRFEASKAFEAADDEWHRLLEDTFGKAAGDARYDERGRGQEGTPLRAAYDAREAARAAWEAAR